MTPQPYAIPVFDTDAMLIEVSLLLDWYLPDTGDGDAAMREFFALWRDLLSAAAAPATWVIRDYHSPNLIWLD